MCSIEHEKGEELVRRVEIFQHTRLHESRSMYSLVTTDRILESSELKMSTPAAVSVSVYGVLYGSRARDSIAFISQFRCPSELNPKECIAYERFMCILGSCLRVVSGSSLPGSIYVNAAATCKIRLHASYFQE